MTYAVVLEREEDGRFTVTVPDLLGCVTWGETREEAMANAREAVECFLESLAKLGRPVRA